MLRVSSHSQIFKLCFTRKCYSNLAITNFSETKQGTGSGPFVELPDVQQLQDSVLVKIPAFCTVYGNINQICAINAAHGLRNYVIEEHDSERFITKFKTVENAVNMILSLKSATSNVKVLNVSNYEKGFVVPEFQDTMLCYSGDLTISNNNEIKGLGLVVLSAAGSLHELNLQENEDIVVAPESLAAYDSQMQKSIIGLKSQFQVPDVIKSILSKYSNSWFEKLNLYISKYFRNDKLFYKISGPGTILLQTQFSQRHKSYDDKSLLEAFK